MKELEEKLKSELILETAKDGKKGDFDRVQVDEDTVQIIIISLDEELYALPAERVFEIGENLKIFPVPGTPAYVLGVQNHRGDIASILSLKVLLQTGHEEKGTGYRVIFTQKDDNIIGYLVDTVEDVIDYPHSKIKEILLTMDKSKKDFISGEIFFLEKHIPLLNVDKIFDRALQGMTKLMH